jgi:hypothetical protein
MTDDSIQLAIPRQTVRRIALAVILAALIAVIAFLAVSLAQERSSVGGFVNDDRFQAVFLEDGRVFFGKLVSSKGDYYEMRDAYYVQQVPGKKEKDQPTQEAVARTADLHGPDGRMLIPKDAVLFIENLRRDSQLAETIDRLRKAGRE